MPKNNNATNHVRYLIDNKSPFIITEAFRNIASNIGFAVPKKEGGKGKVICISSAIMGEGKSTIVANLGYVYAENGAKTIVVDCDMRKPSIKKFFGLGKGKGLVDYLSGQASYEEVLCKDVRPNLDVIPTFKVAPNPVALINSNNYIELIEKLANEYEYVIVDTPPITVVSDGIAISSKADGVALVVRSEHSDHKSLQGAITNLLFAGCNFLGFIVNDTRTTKKNKKGYYKNYYSYGSKNDSTEEAQSTSDDVKTPSSEETVDTQE